MAALAARDARGTVRSWTSRSSSRSWRCSGATDHRARTSSGSCSRGRATARRTTRRATSIARVTGNGWRCPLGPVDRRAGRAARRPAGPGRASRGSRAEATGPSTPTSSTRAVGDWIARADDGPRWSRRSRRRRRRSRRSTTRATSSRTRSSEALGTRPRDRRPRARADAHAGPLFRLSANAGASS